MVPDALPDLIHLLAHEGFARVPAAVMRNFLAKGGLQDWDVFTESWNDLQLDTYMADGGRYRRRRHATLRVTADTVQLLPHQPHYQSLHYNHLNGGVARHFAPIHDSVVAGATMQSVLHLCRDVFQSLSKDVAAWFVELHQFRIEAHQGQTGLPTPEGPHRDGVDWVLVLLVNRHNIASGVTAISDLNGVALGSFTLTTPLDAAWVDDHRVFHGVTPVLPEQPGQPAFRDVLVVTFRREDSP